MDHRIPDAEIIEEFISLVPAHVRDAVRAEAFTPIEPAPARRISPAPARRPSKRAVQTSFLERSSRQHD